MVRRSPFATGFRALRRERSVLLAEIGWRWMFGGIATALIAWGVVLFLKSVEVTRGDQLLLRSMNPTVIVYVLRDLLSDRWLLLARLGLIVAVTLSFLWIITASIARTATTRVLLDFSAAEFAEERETQANLLTVGAIHFLRIALLWVGLFAYVLSAMLASGVTSANGEVHTGAFLLVFFPLFLVAAVVLAFCNWVLLLAPIFAIRDAARLTSSVAASWRLTRARAGGFVGLNLAHLAMRVIWIVFISSIGAIPFGLAHLFPASLIIAATVAITLLYCALSDALFVARYAGYIAIAEQQLHPAPALERAETAVQPAPDLPSPFEAVPPDEPLAPLEP